MAAEPQVSAAQLADQLSDGFTALSEEYQVLVDQHRELENKLSWAKQQYLELMKRCTPETVSQDHLNFLHDLEEVTSTQQNAKSDWLEQLTQNEDGDRRTRAYLIKQARIALEKHSDAVKDNGVKIWGGPSADKDKTSVSVRSKSHAGSALNLERDFTTPGTPSRLGCPFATPSGRKLSASGRQSPLATPRSSMSRMSPQGRRSKRPSFNDPIRAEICGNDPVSTPASADGSAAVCPIRFLDQHSPEEVAKYFENHKHEIPRSHEVCVKRFQSNAESIRQLDAKYGNLVSMIQGLGVKHQPWLPEKPDDEVEEPIDEQESTEKVKKWAKAVSVSLQEDQPEETQEDEHLPDEERAPHFDRPLKEIRVGESPSRPWGITVPTKYTNAGSASSAKSATTASPLSKSKIEEPAPGTAVKPATCPFDHTKMRAGSPPDAVEHDQTNFMPEEPTQDFNQPPPQPPPEPSTGTGEGPKPAPQMVFNGPVFIGYPPEQIMAFLQQGGLGGKS
ncbi:hypothetical protein AOQ84DRAFT_334658 [Glonium stellatum]|uniref:Uncharacterized protein n=1 Tax=Glonium stellatum TaxID=574774 RepID=A0A8E2JWY1_9PEZI|nr:hypothetical protein AOQ84DRAFT_334658 [Glonium stellatum]